MKKKLHHFVPILTLCFILSISYAQKAPEKGMTAAKYNFTSFTSVEKQNIELWKKYNSPEDYNHPEFGILPADAPCKECIEVLNKRNADERYFINAKKPSEFFSQKALGDLNELINGKWVTINHKLKPFGNAGDGLYQSNLTTEPVGIDTKNKRTYIVTPTGKIYFNNWSLLAEVNGMEALLDSANWSDYTIGEEGLKVYNIFKGIDAEMVVFRGSIKTLFIIKTNEYGQFTSLLFRDNYQSANQNPTRTAFTGNPASSIGEGQLTVFNGTKEILKVKEAVLYPLGGTKDNALLASYKIRENNKVDIIVPFTWINKNIGAHQLVVDPLVSGTNTLAQALITGSRYNASCLFTNSCNYNLSVPTPPFATFTDVLWSFNYSADGFLCYLQDGAVTFTRGACTSPSAAGFYWYCNLIGGGTCIGSNISIFTDVSACLPPPACVAQNVAFVMHFYRDCFGPAGCDNTCIGAASPWTMTIQGHTVEFNNAVTPITPTVSTVCAGQSVAFSSLGTYGVPPYTYNWSLNASGVPSAGAGANPTINFPTAGAYTVYCIITDACGQTTSSSVPVTVNTPVVTNAGPDQTVCAGGSIVLNGSVTGGAVTGTWSAPSGTFAPSATALNATYTPTIASGTVTLTLTSSSPLAPCPVTTDQMVVTVNPQIVPTFAPIGPLCQGSAAPALPASSTNLPAITGTWAPAVISTAVAGTTIYTFTPTAGQCATTATMSITVNPLITPTFTAIGPLCQGSVAPVLPASSTNLPAITGTWAPAVISTAVAGTTVYTFTPTAGQCASTTTMSITITNLITPTFTAIGPLCQGSAPPALPAASTNLPAITGTWAPAAISTAAVGTTVYTFTPNPGQCAATTTMSITITNLIPPTFTAIGPLCQASVAPAFPAASTNVPAITGTWAPAVISTAAVGTTVYNFTPNPGQCAATTTMSITITNLITPTFNAIGPLCQGAPAPPLLASSTNIPAITGTWAPALISTAAIGTTVYTFTPNPGQCAGTTTLSITITTPITPTFAAIPNVCQGGAAPVLPLTSTNLPAITGTWAPAVSTATAGTTVYTFAPNAGQCAVTSTLNITVDPLITPTFTAIPNVCQGSAAPVLPLSSTNLPAITGTWAPAVSTAAAGTTVYTFTPTAGQCASTTTLSITVDPLITPTFAAIPNVCQGSAAPVLPLSSTNLPAITGTWAPAVSTAVAGTTVYTFTPNAGQCATTTTLNITVDPLITPTFAAIPNICQGGAAPVLPLSSTNLPAITGTWAPAVSTAVAGTTVYTFTPSAGQCATTATLNITIDPLITPSFTALGQLCQNSVAPVLPTSSNDLPAITGTWNAPISTTTVGTTVYTFTPNAGQCATTTTMSITVTTLIVPLFTAIPNVCQGAAAPVLPLASNDLPPINGTWAPAVSTAVAGTTVYTFTPAAGQCATTTTLNITVDAQITPAFTAIPNVCQGSAAPVLPTSSNDLPAITGTWAPAVSTAAAGTTVYTFTPNAGQCATTTTLSITVDPLITPTFAAIPNVCQGGAAPVLPLNSTNLPAITGTWAPAVSTAVAGTTVYTFTPSAGQCATTTTLNITIDPQIIPTFAPVSDVCLNAAAPVLPVNSTNLPAITGTWAPAVSTAAVGTTVYTFTPTAGQCATTATTTITVTTTITPTFTAIPNICQNSVAPVLPLSSTNLPAITGTWDAPISTVAAGTTVYTFTPAAGQCAIPTTMNITIDPQITPTFTAIPNVCIGSAAPVLPTSSNDLPAINGTWAPAVSTAAAGTTVYTFTPNPGECATTTTLSITVDSQVLPTFTAVPNVCVGSAAPVLPTNSNDLPAIIGTWAPAVSTAVAGTTVYTFTPNAGQCASTTTLNITVDAQIVPSFTAIANVCQNSAAPVIPTSSNDLPAITGTWAPAVSTITAGTSTYTFTPTAGQCASTTTLDITVDPQIVPSFTAIANVCQGAAAPVIPTSSNDLPAITGTWAPAVSTAAAGTTTYTFTPSVGQCATTTTLNITVDALPVITNPVLTQAICSGGTASFVPTSTIAGTTFSWTASASAGTITGFTAAGTGNINQVLTNIGGTAGTVTYAITPTAPGATACAGAPVNYVVTVTPIPVPVAGSNSPVCAGSALSLTGSPLAGGTYAWSGPIGYVSALQNPTVSAAATVAMAGVYTLTETVSGCVGSTTTTVIVNPTPTATVTGGGAVCAGNPTPTVTITLTGTPPWTVTYSNGTTNTTINPGTSPVTLVDPGAGVYTVVFISDANCTGTASGIAADIVHAVPVPVLTPDITDGCTPLCVTFVNHSIFVSAGDTLLHFQISFGDTTFSVINHANPIPFTHCYPEGVFSVAYRVTSNFGCSATVVYTDLIHSYPKPTAVYTTSPNTMNLSNPNVLFRDHSLHATSWQWDFGDINDPIHDTSTLENPRWTYTDAGTFCSKLVVSNHDVCFDTARWCVVVEPDFALWIPNAFTPNGDGYNDEFFCKGENIIKFDMNIFDRWGNKIFTSNNISDKWDGSFGGQLAQQDVYVYIVHAMDNLNQDHKFVGKVTLVR